MSDKSLMDFAVEAYFLENREETKRSSQRYRTVWTALEMQMLCNPARTNGTVWSWEQSLLFLLTGKDFLSSEEETEEKEEGEG